MCDGGAEGNVQCPEPVQWLCTNVRHLLHRIGDLEVKVAVSSSRLFVTDGWKETFNVLILFIDYVQMFDIFFVASMISKQGLLFGRTGRLQPMR